MIPNPGIRVLLVDDEVSIRSLYQISLERLGMHVSTVAGVQEALRVLNIHSFDVTVVDLHLLDGSGMEVVRHLRKSGMNKVLAMSGYAFHTEILAELRSLEVDFFCKSDPLSGLGKMIIAAYERQSRISPRTTGRHADSSVEWEKANPANKSGSGGAA